MAKAEKDKQTNNCTQNRTKKTKQMEPNKKRGSISDVSNGSADHVPHLAPIVLLITIGSFVFVDYFQGYNLSNEHCTVSSEM